ncbi:hypothetical protein TNCT_606011 [Trichonephila clavata]|uniref:Uncharacterized protein n=1 Tax=Trichonephila clavata TaxID=2740835 RepID=A0A8X6LEX1_TRICU|nr:hypothetical protein TNCT_606011 [Trichonephila clavata]
MHIVLHNMMRIYHKEKCRKWSLSGHTSTIECVKFGQCEDIVCAGSSSGALKIWDLEAAKIIRTLLGHKGNVKCVDFHPYGDFVASGSSDSNIKLGSSSQTLKSKDRCRASTGRTNVQIQSRLKFTIMPENHPSPLKALIVFIE